MMGVIAFKAHKAANEERKWDGGAARKRLLDWADGDWDKFAQGFAWVDSEKREMAGGYKLPHADVIDGELCDVWAGVSAAMGALLGARGGVDIPEEDRKGVYSHLKRHYGQWDKEAPEFRIEDGEDEGQEMSTVRAGLVAPAGGAESNIERALAVINARFAQTPLTAEEVYLLPPAEMSNQNLDSYFTRMAESSLRNYLQDGLGGVPLMNSHRKMLPAPELPIGKSYDAVLEETQGGLRLVEYFYMLRGLELNGHKTNDLIRGIEGGTISDVSIGFGGGWYKCGLCGRELVSGWARFFGDVDEEKVCEHVPGIKYDGKVAFAWVEDAHQGEGSLVYAGATPGAVLRKARWAAATGRLSQGDARMLEDRWGVRVLDSRWWAVGRKAVDVAVDGGVLMGQEQDRGETREGVEEVTREEVVKLVGEKAPELADRVQAADDPVGALLEAWADAKQSREAQDIAATAEWVKLGEQLAASEARVAELEGLRALAEDGRAYRGELVEQAVKARVRAQGAAFDAEAYRKVLEGQSMEYVRSEVRAWETSVRQVFEPGRPAGKVIGREQDRGKGEDKQKSADKKPAKQYKA